MSKTPRIAACQFEPVVGDLEANYKRIDELTASLDDDVTVAVFPELCVTGYDLEVAEERATPVSGNITDPLVEIAIEHDIGLVVGVPERDGSARYNALAFVDSAGVRTTYRKQYLWGDESDVFDAGSGPVTTETELGKIGFLLCYDLNFPEAALAYGRTECDVLVVSAAWRESHIDNWTVLARSRALDGTCYVVGSNHSGEQRDRRHGGCSLIADPCGEVVEKTGTPESSVVVPLEDDRLQHCRRRNPVAAYRRQTQ